MQLYPHLTFNGQCEAAFRLYEKCFHGKTTFMMTYENTPMDLHTPPDWGKKISHATFAVADLIDVFHSGVGAHLQNPGRKRDRSNVAAGNLLGASLWRAR